MGERNCCTVYHLVNYQFLQTEPDPYAALVFHPLEAELEGHHYKFVVTSNIGAFQEPILEVTTNL